MSYIKKQLLYSGKAKSLFATDDPQILITVFRDDTTAFDGVKHELLHEKGLTNNKISSFIMQHLAKAGVATHFIQTLSPTEILVKKLTMISLESVVRNIAAGSLTKRYGIESGTKLNKPLVEFFVKSDALHDPLISENTAIALGYATPEQIAQMTQITLKINSVLTELFAKCGLILVDAKFEFGLDQNGAVILGDEISPDSCRIWDAKTLDSLDKDRFRKDLGGVMEAYKEIAARLKI